MGKRKFNTTLDAEATIIGNMAVTKSPTPMDVACFRCETTKPSRVRATWTTSRGPKDLCQGCTGGVHQLALAAGAVVAGKVRNTAPPAKASEAPKGCCEVCAPNVLVAAGVGHAACVTAWLDAGADVEFGGRKKLERPLHKAAANGHAACVGLLLDRGARIDGSDKAGRTALWRAADAGKADTVELLLARGADATIAAPVAGATGVEPKTATPLDAAKRNAAKKRNPRTKDDEAAKHAAAADARARVVAMLEGRTDGAAAATDGDDDDEATAKAAKAAKKEKKRAKAAAGDDAAPPAKKLKKKKANKAKADAA